MIKVGLLGTGRMGLEVAGLLSDSIMGMELADAVSNTKKIRSIEGIEVRSWDEPAREPVHVWVDFSRPEATLQLLETVDAPVVIGTTGFSEPQTHSLKKFATKVPLLVVPNLSRGMHTIKKMLNVLPSTFSEIILSEAHHREKKDSPSGTAQALEALLKNKSTGTIPIHSTRAGNILGTHTIHLVLEDEEIFITHQVTHRRVFARGALLAARFLIGKPSGWYSLEDVFK